MKKSLLLSAFTLLIATMYAQFRGDYRSIPDKEPEVMVITEGVCCCEFVYNYNPPSSDGRMLFVPDSLELFMNKQTMGGIIISGYIDQMCAGSIIRMYKQDDPTGVFRHFLVTAKTFIDPIYEFSVEVIDEDGELVKNQNFCVELDANCGGNAGVGYIPLTGTDVGAPCTGPIEMQVLTGEAYFATTSGGVQMFAENGAFTGAVVCANDEIILQTGDTTDAVSVFIHPHHLWIEGSGDFHGAEYTNHYWANYTEYSLPDVGYVNGLLNGYVPLNGTLFGQGVTGPIEYVYTGIDPDTFMYCNSPVGDFRLFQGAAGNIQFEQLDGDLQKSLIIDNDPQSVRMQIQDMVDFDNGKVQCGENFAEMSTNNATENTKIRIEPNSIVIEGGPSQNFAGAQYAYDHSADYTDRSLVDKEFVVDSIAALQMPNIAPANAGDIVAKFNTLLTYLIAAGLMAP